MHALDQLAETLRERLVERAREARDGLAVEEQVRELVATEAGALPEPERERFASGSQGGFVSRANFIAQLLASEHNKNTAAAAKLDTALARA